MNNTLNEPWVGIAEAAEYLGVTKERVEKAPWYKGFCSPNSGMQGSRAIEKMRALKRLDRDFDSAQRTLFDLKLFASIMNQINELEMISFWN